MPPPVPDPRNKERLYAIPPRGERWRLADQDHPTLRQRRAQAESRRVLGFRTCGIVGPTRHRSARRWRPLESGAGRHAPSAWDASCSPTRTIPRSANAGRRRNRGGSWGSGRAESWVSRGTGRQDGGDPSNRGRAVTRRQRGMLLARRPARTLHVRGIDAGSMVECGHGTRATRTPLDRCRRRTRRPSSPSPSGPRSCSTRPASMAGPAAPRRRGPSRSGCSAPPPVSPTPPPRSPPHHGWSHAAAYAYTAARTDELLGLRWGGGLWVNYAFTILWVGEALWWQMWPESHARRPRAWKPAVRGAFLFMIVNGAVVFVDGPGGGSGAPSPRR